MNLMVGSTRTSKTRRWLRGIAIGVVLLVAALWIASAVILRVSRIDPPPVPAYASPAMEVRGPRAYIGPDWMTRERGLWELHLEGEPFAMGQAHTRLSERLLNVTEDYMFGEMHRYVPSKVAMFLIRLGVSWQYRHLADHIPAPQLVEIAGQASGYYDTHGDFLPTFQRMIFYHALHDITQKLEHSPLLGCTAFAVAGPATVDGHLLVGRNFDFEGPKPFDQDKAVLFFKPAGKIPFASVAWPGMSGVVTGVNAAGIYISINAARTDDKGQVGIPVELLARLVMEQARSLDDAIRILKDNPVMVPDFYLLADGKTGESAVVERSPTRLEVRRSKDTTLLTNHALTPAFAHDVANDRLKRYLTSGSRFERLAELVKQQHGKFDARRVLEVLRDKRGVGDAPLGLGNRNALDAIIATHSVVVDLSAMTLWVSMGPHLLGRYVGYDLRKELGDEHGVVSAEDAARPDPPDLPADPTLDSPELRAYYQASDELKEAERLAKLDKHRAIESAERAIGLEETMPEPHKLLGDLVRESDPARARKEYQRFLELHPPHLHDVEEVKGHLASL